MVIFEDYIRDRTNTINSLCQFLGVANLPQPLDSTNIHNRSNGKLVLNEFWGQVRKSDFYLKTLRGKLPASLKEQLKKLFLSTAPSRPAPPSSETVNWILEQTAEETANLANFVNRQFPTWEPQQVQKTYSHANESTSRSRDKIACKAPL